MAKALTISIVGDASKFSKTAKDVEGDLDKIEGKAKRSGEGLGQSLTKAGAAMAVAGGAIAAVLVTTAKAYDEQVQADTKLQNTLKNQPALVGASMSAFTDQASALQLVTAASDDSIESGQAMLGMYGATKDQILGLTPLIVDYSRKLGVDMDTAAKNVGKALDGNLSTLQRSGIMVDQAAFATDRYRAIQSALASTVGGFAQQEGATFSGRMEIIKNQIGELQEGIGKGVVDAASKALGPVAALSKAFQGMTPETQAAVGSIAAYGSAALVAAGGVSYLAGKLDFMKGHMGSATVAAAALTVGLGAVNSVLENAADAAADAFKSEDSGYDALVAKTHEVSESYNQRVTALQQQGVVSQFTHFQEYKDLQAIRAQIDENNAAIQRYQQGYSGLGRELGISRVQAEDLARSLNIDIMQVPAEQLVSVLRQYQAGAISAEQATKALTGSQGKLSESAADLKKEYNDAKQSVSEFSQKILDTLTANDSAKLSYLDLRDHLGDVAKKLRENGTQWDWVNGRINENSAQGRDNERMILQTKQQIVNYGLEMIKSGHSVDEATQASLGFVDGLRNTMMQAGFTKDQTDKLLTSFGLTPDRITTTFQQPGLQAAVTDTTDLNTKLDRTNQGANGTVSLNTEPAKAAIRGLAADFAGLHFSGVSASIEGRASGGPVSPGGLYEVNERGPEVLAVGGRQFLMMGNEGGTVSPGGGSGARQPIVISIDGREVARALVDVNAAYSNSAGL